MKLSTFKTILVFAALLFVPGCAFADGATLSVLPSASTISAGDTTTLDVNISGVSDLYAFEFDVLFNSATVSAVSEIEGGFLPGGGTTFFIPGTIDNVGGSIAATADTLIGAVSGAGGDGTLVALQFTGLAPGTTSIGLANATLLDSNLNSIDATIQDGSITVQGAVVPAAEPSCIVLLGAGLLGLAVFSLKKPFADGREATS